MSNKPLVPFDAGKPSIARAYDYALGGKDNFAAAFRRAMPPGGFLVISIGINNNTPDVAQAVIEAYTAGTVHVHSREQIAGYFAGLQIIEPGLTEARHWRPSAQAAAEARTADVLAGVGRTIIH